MTDETIRTLITALAAVLTTALTVWFALRSQERKERLYKLEKELRQTYAEFVLLYEVEKEYLAELSKHLKKAESTIKIEFRDRVCSKTNDKITLAPNSIIKRIKDLDIT
jgi:hypothetical protein